MTFPTHRFLPLTLAFASLAAPARGQDPGVAPLVNGEPLAVEIIFGGRDLLPGPHPLDSASLALQAETTLMDAGIQLYGPDTPPAAMVLQFTVTLMETPRHAEAPDTVTGYFWVIRALAWRFTPLWVGDVDEVPTMVAVWTNGMVGTSTPDVATAVHDALRTLLEAFSRDFRAANR